MTLPSITQILRIAGSGVFEKPLTKGDRRTISAITPSDEHDLSELLGQHRLQYMFWCALKTHELQSALSVTTRESFALAFQASLVKSATFDWGFAQVTAALDRAQVPIIACKGTVLSQLYYPSRGLRRMHDLDFWLLGSDVERCGAVLGSIGFIERTEKANAESRNYVNLEGVVLDVHSAMRLFQSRGYALETLSEQRADSCYRVFVPEAMVAHLIAHFLGHAHDSGILLCWMIDIALVLRQHQIDIPRLQELLAPDGSWLVFLRLIRAFCELGWLEHTFGLEAATQSVRPVNWEIVARQRRRSGWRGLRGKLRLCKGLLQSRELGAPVPELQDFFWKPLDWWREENAYTGGKGALLIARHQ